VFMLIMSIEFWVGFLIKFFITEFVNRNNMNVFKIIIAGVGAMMWGLTAL